MGGSEKSRKYATATPNIGQDQGKTKITADGLGANGKAKEVQLNPKGSELGFSATNPSLQGWELSGETKQYPVCKGLEKEQGHLLYFLVDLAATPLFMGHPGNPHRVCGVPSPPYRRSG